MPAQEDLDLLSNGNARSSSPAIDIPSGRSSPVLFYSSFYNDRPRTPIGASMNTGIDRELLIRNIKSREDRSRPTSPELTRHALTRSVAATKPLNNTASDHGQTAEEGQSNMDSGMQIERPKSALHRGDFREKEDSPSAFDTFSNNTTQPILSTSPPAPWHQQFAASAFRQAWHDRRRTGRLSVSAQHLFYQAPTSPLAQSSRPETPPAGADVRRSSRSPDKQSRRHTFSPQALHRYASDFEASKSSPTVKPALRKEATYPYQAHQPRRSLHSLTVPSSPPRSTFFARRPSASEQHSPLQHAPMVGSYEESILRGRMSTTPSKPLNFVAQIGVLGRNECKPSLRCPPHVTVPFPAVFYSYGAGARQGSNDQPSPYVGMVDLEQNLPNHDDLAKDRRRQRLGERLHAALSDDGGISRTNSRSGEEAQIAPDVAQTQRVRRQQKARRRSGSPKAPPGGSYRIPQQGQLQIVIKNPNKTAVKLFLIPYDLSDMQPSQKTFIRQRSYSAGPIIDMPMSSRKNYGTDRPEAALSNSDDPNDRPVLRYLVHLHICCTSKGRYWLYKSIRVVFANRVPDGKEKLRNEIQLPEPRYTSYKPNRNEARGTSVPSSPANAVVRNRVRGDLEDGMDWKPTPMSLPAAMHGPAMVSDLHSYRFPLPSSRLETLDSRPVSRDALDRSIDDFGPGEPVYSGQLPDAELRILSTQRRESILSQRLRQLDM